MSKTRAEKATVNFVIPAIRAGIKARKPESPARKARPESEKPGFRYVKARPEKSPARIVEKSSGSGPIFPQPESPARPEYIWA